MLLALYKFHELFSNLTSLGVSSNHAYPWVWIIAMQIGPHLTEGFLELVSFDDEGQLKARGFWTVFEVSQKVDCIKIELPLRSEAYMMIWVEVIEIMVSARL